jgi:hypothetical protein
VEEEILDTYFFNLGEALQEAQKQNTSGIFNDLQICYYNGPEMPNNPYPNLISLPIDNICDYMSETPNRIIRKIQFDSTFTQEEQSKMTILISDLQKIAWRNKAAIGDEYRKVIKELKPDFNDQKLRVLFLTTRTTTVLQYVSKNLADAFDSLGHDTLVSIEENAMQSWGANDSHNNSDFAWHLKNIYEFNPHIIFNLDWINNSFLGDDVFNFIWFQDPMETLYNEEKINLRDRDFFYSLNDVIDNLLNKHHIPFKRQGFCVNSKVFYDRKLERENKIVFIGSSLVYFEEAYNDVAYNLYYKIRNDIKTNPKEISRSYIEKLSQQSSLSYDYILTNIYVHALREVLVEYICTQKKIKVEVYGRRWENNEIVKPFFKGEIPHGEEVAKVYNSAKYALAGVHPYEKALQRVPEVLACGTIPIMYDIRPFIEEEYEYDEVILKFNYYDELLEYLVKEPPSKDLDNIIESFSFKHLANDILKTVQSTLEKDEK